jgi:hypothetical protein
LSALKDLAFFKSDMRFEKPAEFLDQILCERRGVPQCTKARVVIANPRGKLELFEFVERWEKKNLLDLKMRL